MDAIDGFIMLLLCFAGLCFVLKLGFLWSAIAALFHTGQRRADPQEIADEAIEKARTRSRVRRHWTEDERYDDHNH